MFIIALAFSLVASGSRLSPHGFILLLDEEPSLPRTKTLFSLIGISVAAIFLQGRVAGPTPNPPPFSAGLGTVLGEVHSEVLYQNTFETCSIT